MNSIIIGKKLSKRYLIQKKLTKGSMGDIYAALDLENQNRSVAVKILKKTSKSVKDFVRFQSEYDTLSTVDHPNIVKIYDHGTIGESYSHLRPYIVMEYLTGLSLADHLANNVVFSLKQTITIILQLCGALECIHAHNIIHADLKPSNVILISGGTEEYHVKLIDFGLTRIRNHQKFCRINEVFGTFHYKPPEQSGLIDHSVDERSDIYSLGIIFYELLTSRLPLSDNNLIGLLHQQIAKKPIPPSDYNRKIPSVLNDIVCILLEKEPENRYQKITGLIVDLQRLLEGEDQFQLSRNSLPVNLSYVTPCIGMEAELSQLDGLTNKTLEGNGSICMIAGEAGSGKTTLVKEFRKHVLSLNMVIIDARAVERKTKTSWQLFKDILDQYLKWFESYDVQKKKYITKVLKRKYNYMGSIIMQLSPDFQVIFGDCPKLSEIDAEKEIRRFYLCITQFLCFLAEIEKGLVIIFEDLHWTDTGSLKLLKELSNHIAKSPLLVTGTYRIEEFEENTGLYNTIQALVEVSCFCSLSLKPFNETNMRHLIAGIFHGEYPFEKTLAQFVLKKSRGNPLFAKEIVKQVIFDNLVYWENSFWLLNEERLCHVQIPSNILDMLLKRISRIEPQDNDVLSIASIVGKKFNTELLFKLVEDNTREKRKELVLKILAHAEKKQLIERCDSSGYAFIFAHDRIKETYYKKTNHSKRIALHKKIAEYIQKGRYRPDAFIFDLAHHCIESENSELIIANAYPAALQALKEYDYEGGLKYFIHVKQALESQRNADQILSKHPLWLECMQKIGESYLGIGMVDEALSTFNQILPHLCDKLHEAHISHQIMMAYFRKNDFSACVQWAQKGLQMLGESLPVSKLGLLSRTIKEFTVHFLRFHYLYNFIDRKTLETDQKIKLIIRIYDTLFWVYYYYDPNKVPATVLRMMNLTQKKLGESKELITSFCHYGLMGLGIPILLRSDIYLNKAYRLSRKMKYDFGLAQSLSCLGAYHLARCEFLKVVECCEKSIEILSEIGDFMEYVKSGLFLFSAYFLRSEYENAERILKLCDKFIKSTSDELIYVSIGMLPYYYIETGQFQKAEEMLKAFSAFQAKTRSWIMYCSSMIAFGLLYTEMGKLERAFQYFEKALGLIKRYRFPMHFLHVIYPFYAFALIINYRQQKDHLDRKSVKANLKKIKKFCHRGLYYSNIWPYHSTCAMRSYAQYLALINQPVRAEKYFLRCLESSRRIAKRNAQAMVHYCYGLFLKEIGRKKEAWSQLESAYRIFDEIGVNHYKKRIVEILGMGNDAPASLIRYIQEEKSASILKFGKQLSDYNDFKKLADVIISKAMEITGAQAGGLFFCQDDASDQLQLRAIKNISDEATLEYSKNIVQEAFEKGKIIIIPNAKDDEAYLAHQSVARYRLKSILCIPIQHNDFINGVCYLHNSLVRGVFTEEDARLLGLFLSYGAIAVENVLLRQKLSQASSLGDIKVDTRMEKKLNRALNYIEDNFQNEISREQLARELALEPNYLGRAFKVHVGRSIRDHLNELRINKSLDQILKTDQKIIDIAFDVGFKSLRTFNRIFYQIMGETPSKIREKYKSPNPS